MTDVITVIYDKFTEKGFMTNSRITLFCAEVQREFRSDKFISEGFMTDFYSVFIFNGTFNEDDSKNVVNKN